MCQGYSMSSGTENRKFSFPSSQSRADPQGMKMKAGGPWTQKEQLNASDLLWMHYLPSELHTLGSTGRFSIGHKG